MGFLGMLSFDFDTFKVNSTLPQKGIAHLKIPGGEGGEGEAVPLASHLSSLKSGT